MASIDLQTAYANKRQSGDLVANDQQSLAALQDQLRAAAQRLSDDTAADSANAAVLSSGAAQVPNDSVILTDDGTILVVFGGSVHEYGPDKQVKASSVTFDSAPAPAGNGSGPVTPPPDTGTTPAPPDTGTTGPVPPDTGTTPPPDVTPPDVTPPPPGPVAGGESEAPGFIHQG